MRIAFVVVALLAGSLLPSAASAYDWYTVANVAAIEGTYAPSIVRFWLTTTVGTCPAGQEFGSQMDYKASGTTIEEKVANSQMIAAMLMTARATGRQIKIFGRNSDCTAEFIYLL